MLRSDAEEKLKFWKAGERKIFRYRRFLFPDEYITFRRTPTDGMETDVDNSTYKNLQLLDKDAFLRLMMNEELIYVGEPGWSNNVTDMKTGGCTCGIWLIKDNAGLTHSDYCKKGLKR